MPVTFLLDLDEIDGSIVFANLAIVLDGDVPMPFLDGVQILDKFGDSHVTAPHAPQTAPLSQGRMRFVFHP